MCNVYAYYRCNVRANYRVHNCPRVVKPGPDQQDAKHAARIFAHRARTTAHLNCVRDFVRDKVLKMPELGLRHLPVHPNLFLLDVSFRVLVLPVGVNIWRWHVVVDPGVDGVCFLK